MKIEYNKSKPHSLEFEKAQEGKIKQTVHYILFSHPHYEKIEVSTKLFKYI